MNRNGHVRPFLPTMSVAWDEYGQQGILLQLNGPTPEQIEWLRQVLAEMLAQKGARQYFKGTLRAIGQEMSFRG